MDDRPEITELLNVNGSKRKMAEGVPSPVNPLAKVLFGSKRDTI